MSYPSDLEIARKAELKPLTDIAKESGIPESSLELYGEGAAKIKLDAIDAMTDKPKAKYVVVTAITPTPLGEGKTTTTSSIMYEIIRKFSSGKKINLSLDDKNKLQLESEKSIFRPNASPTKNDSFLLISLPLNNVLNIMRFGLCSNLSIAITINSGIFNDFALISINAQSNPAKAFAAIPPLLALVPMYIS